MERRRRREGSSSDVYLSSESRGATMLRRRYITQFSERGLEVGDYLREKPGELPPMIALREGVDS